MASYCFFLLALACGSSLAEKLDCAGASDSSSGCEATANHPLLQPGRAMMQVQSSFATDVNKVSTSPKGICYNWCKERVEAGFMTWAERCGHKMCMGCGDCPAVKICDPSCSSVEDAGKLDKCKQPECEACLECPQELPTVEAVHNSPTPGEYIDLTIGVREICTQKGCGYLRGFMRGPGTLGPTIHVKPGETLKVRLINTLEEPNPAPQKSEYGYFNYTNFHTHGLHVSGRPGQDHVLTECKPGESRLYDIVLPEDHMGGNHWYHDHTHHATAFHAGGGMAGMLIVDDDDGAIPDSIKNMPQHLMMVTLSNLPRLKKIAKTEGDGLKLDKFKENSVFLAVNGVREPVVVVKSGEWNRFRMTFASMEMMLEMVLEENSLNTLPMPDCEMQLLAKDGIYLAELPRAIKGVHLFPGARADFAIRCSCSSPPCSAAFVSHDSDSFDPQGPGTHEGTIVQLEVVAPGSGSLAQSSSSRGMIKQGDPFEDPSVKFKVHRPCYLADLRSLTVPEDKILEIDMIHPGYPPFQKNGEYMRGMKVNDKPWFVMTHAPHDEAGLKETALAVLEPATVYELLLDGMHHHPFHSHVHPFQLMDWATTEELKEWKTDAFVEYYQSGDWHDIILHPRGKGHKYSSNVRMVTDRYFGEQVVHCHTLWHEDQGMMGWFWTEGTDGLEYTGAEALDATCYRPSNGKSPGFEIGEAAQTSVAPEAGEAKGSGGSGGGETPGAGASEQVETSNNERQIEIPVVKPVGGGGAPEGGGESACVDSTSWGRAGQPSKGCAWTNGTPGRCKFVDDSGVSAIDACCASCGRHR